MEYQQFYDDRTNPYGAPNRVSSNINEKRVMNRHPDKGGEGDSVCFSKDGKECARIKTTYQYQMRSEKDVGKNRYAKRFSTYENSKLSSQIYMHTPFGIIVLCAISKIKFYRPNR